VVDSASDVAGIADSLGLDKFGVWGHSGGGDPALACASVLPDRVVAAACLAGCAPYPAEGIDWFSGMGELNVEDFKLLLSDQGEWEKKNSQEAEILKHAPRAEFEEFLRSLLSDIDRSFLSDELIDFFQAQTREGFKAGIDGMLDDNLAQSKQWGFDPASIRVPVQIWHGRHDRFVPFSHGQWLVDHIPQGKAHLEEQEGHLSLFVNRIPEVHNWLTGKF
jgi:pimeloyl-ACP methyl ester carboxylesterase